MRAKFIKENLEENRYQIMDSYDDPLGKPFSTVQEAESKIEELELTFGRGTFYIIDNITGREV